MSTYLGIDLGTTGTKALLCQADGTVLATATAEHPSLHPRPGWSEQRPEDWWESAVAAVQAVMARAGSQARPVRAIGLSGQMHGSVFLDSGHRVLRPALLWNDQRTAAECAEIEAAAGGRAALIQMVSNPAFTGFTAPKILWVRRHEPGVAEQIRHVLLPKDYLRLRLTGERATDVSDASGTLLLDVTHRRWCRPLLSKLGIDANWMPTCVESDEITGKLTPTAAAALGLEAGIPVVGGAGDQAAGAVGNGIVRHGIISATIGTSGVVFAHADQPQTHPDGRVHTMCHAVRGAWHLMGVILAAGGSLRWVRDQLGQPEVAAAQGQDQDPYDLMLAVADSAPPGSEGLFFLPYLTGERHPHSDPHASGAFVGLTVRHTRAHLLRAVVEGITFAMNDCLAVIRDLGVEASEIRLSGGGARNPLWRQWQADIYGQKVALINAQEGPAFGAAILAMVGAGAYQNVPEACAATIRTVESLAPQPERQALYARWQQQFQRLYPSLASEFPRLAQLARGGAG
ncbi:MAG TPA: xylulokinase [Gemmatales bacterium]|nr:xylulokinase [Gemmatales bacterium]HMP58308.1 xylulokinase [Gemmatales bacterium]